MIGLLILAVLYAYILLANFIVKKVYEKTQSKKKKYIALAIMILIPTWDVILGFPVYAFLCATQSGVKIYKTVDNVEGFYVGESESILIAYQFTDKDQSYHFIDYKDETNGKYYRSYWKDNNISKNCISYGEHKYGDYAEAFRHGRCVIREEIPESAVSQWDISNKFNNETTLIPNYLTKSTVKIMDKSTNKPLAELISYSYGEGWVAIAFSSVAQYSRWSTCTLKKSYQEMLSETLKPKQGNKNGNN